MSQDINIVKVISLKYSTCTSNIQDAKKNMCYINTYIHIFYADVTLKLNE